MISRRAGASRAAREPYTPAMTRLFAAIWMIALLAGCSDAEAKRRASLEKRAASLKQFPLPATANPDVPKSVFVNSNVAKILIVTKPAGAKIKIGGKEIGVSPFEASTADLLFTSDGAAPLEFEVAGKPLKAPRFALRYEAANLMIGINPPQLPSELSSRDLWFYAELAEN